MQKLITRVAVLEIPIAVQVDESQVFLGPIESPNKVLHNILTHKVEGLTEEPSAADDNLQDKEKIYKDADLYPRVVKAFKSSRKGKK